MNNKELPLITFKQYKLFLTAQPYFIWNSSLKPWQALYQQKNHLDLELEPDQDDEDNQDNIGEYFWANLEATFETANLNFSYVEANVNSFEIVRKKTIDAIAKQFAKNDVYFITSKTLEAGVVETNQAIASKKYKVIFYPVFQFQNAIATPLAYFPQEAKISNLSYSSTVKGKIYAKAFWDYWIAKKSLGQDCVQRYSLWLLDILDNYTKNEIAITQIYSAWNGKSSKSYEPLKKKNKLITAEIKKCYKFFGNYDLESDSCDQEMFDIADALEKHCIFENSKKGITKVKYNFDSIENVIDQINKAHQITTILPLENESDNTFFGKNPFAQDMLKISDPEIAQMSGNILKFEQLIAYTKAKRGQNYFANQITNFEVIDILKSQNILSKGAWLSVDKIINNADEINPVIIENLINTLEAKDQVIVWYDFEGFSLPYSILDGAAPYEQLVFQVSIIRTQNNKIISKENIVYDPQKIGVNAFKEIIEKIYSHKASKFVVFNKSYELSKLKRMTEYISAQQNGKFSLVTPIDPNNKYTKQVMHINENTIDLLDLFKSYSNQSRVPDVFISQLRGFSSIKKIENYINANNFKLQFKIKPYKNLEIQNGLMAMNTAINRYLGSIGDQEWNNHKMPKLKEYCENDVMAMLMVYDFVKLLYKNHLKNEK